MYVSDISDDVSSNVIRFADDTKLYSHVERYEDCHTLQENINTLVNWSEKWLMRFNTENAKLYTLDTTTTIALFYKRFQIINNKRRERFRSFDY